MKRSGNSCFTGYFSALVAGGKTTGYLSEKGRLKLNSSTGAQCTSSSLYTHYVGQIGEKILPQGRHTFTFFKLQWLFSFEALKYHYGSLLLPLSCFSASRCRNIKGL